MKILVTIFAFFLSSAVIASPVSLEVEVPADAKAVVFTAKNIVADTCNTYSLTILSGRGAATGTYSIFPSGTELPCPTPAQQQLDVFGEAKIDDHFGQPETILIKFDSEVIPSLKVKFQEYECAALAKLEVVNGVQEQQLALCKKDGLL